MREILFRGKMSNGDKWVQGGLTYVGDKVAYINADLWNGYLVQPETLGQFTGLCDKNGNKIFEGDILRFGKRNIVVWWNSEEFQWQAKTVRGTPECKAYNGEPFVTDWDNVSLGWVAAEVPIMGEMTTEIIGNICDTPELIKERSDIDV